MVEGRRRGRGGNETVSQKAMRLSRPGRHCSRGRGVGARSRRKSLLSNTLSPLLPPKGKWRNGSGRGRGQRRSRVGAGGGRGGRGACARHAGSSGVSLAAPGEAGPVKLRGEPAEQFPLSLNLRSARVRADFSVRGTVEKAGPS